MTLRVLLVEDDPDFGENLAELLEDRQCSVDLALSAEAGATKFRQTGYDLSFVDFKLPGANGVEGFLQIRRIDPTAKVIIMSAYTVEELLAHAVNHGAVVGLIKPLDPERIDRLISTLGARRSVLLADRNPEAAEKLGNGLSRLGYRVYSARSAQHAARLARQQHIDVLVLDIALCDDVDSTHQAWQPHNGDPAPALIISGETEAEFARVRDFRFLPATHILNKLVSPHALIDWIERFQTTLKGSPACSQ